MSTDLAVPGEFGSDAMNESSLGDAMYELMRCLFPICRSLTGDGVRHTLRILQKYIPLEIVEVPSGSRAFDWTVPDEWNIRDAYLADETGRRVIDFRKNNLHVLGYSTSFEGKMSLSELKEHLHTLPNQPDAIPFLTSYYERRWGFCLSQNDLLRLRDGQYHVKIDSSIERGSLTYGELILEGETDKEVLLSTYVCHPSMANDNLSGLAVTTYLTRYLMSVGKRRYTYRIIFVPETIGAIVYLSKHKDHMKEKTIAGYVITCLGDPANFTYLKSRKGNRRGTKRQPSV